YEFSGRTYTKLVYNSHGKVGTLNANSTGTNGPCVTCHMSATEKHKFESVTKDGSGAINAITTSICTNCHSSSLPAATLADKGIVYDSVGKTFKRANGMTIIKWGNASMYGAAYNYRMFIAEPAGYAHNPEYARQLVTDSIDAAYHNGTITGDITAALADLLGRGLITQAQNDSLVTYKSATASCSSCHGAPPTTETSPYLPHSATAFGATYVNTCANCHVYTNANGATHMNGSIDKQGFLITEPHKNNIITGNYSAAYITSKATCADCHNTTAGNLAIRQQWATTSHANTDSPAFANSDFKTQTSTSNCPRCHTTTGFVKFSSARAGGKWADATDKTKEVITCRACHSDVAAGTVRAMTPVKPFASYTAFQNAAMGVSNVCADCHSGRDNGTRKIATYTNFSS